MAAWVLWGPVPLPLPTVPCLIVPSLPTSLGKHRASPSGWLASMQSFPLVSGGQPRASGSILDGSSRGPTRAVPAPGCPTWVQRGLQGVLRHQTHRGLGPALRATNYVAYGRAPDGGGREAVGARGTASTRRAALCAPPPPGPPELREPGRCATVLLKLNFFIKCQGSGQVLSAAAPTPRPAPGAPPPAARAVVWRPLT